MSSLLVLVLVLATKVVTITMALVLVLVVLVLMLVLAVPPKAMSAKSGSIPAMMAMMSTQHGACREKCSTLNVLCHFAAPLEIWSVNIRQ